MISVRSSGISGTASSDCVHAFLWTSTAGMQDLGTLNGGSCSHASGISDFGQVVGDSGNPASPIGSSAFIWTSSSGMQDLNALTHLKKGWTMPIAYGISQTGDIVGVLEQVSGPYFHAVLLTAR